MRISSSSNAICLKIPNAARAEVTRLKIATAFGSPESFGGLLISHHSHMKQTNMTHVKTNHTLLLCVFFNALADEKVKSGKKKVSIESQIGRPGIGEPGQAEVCCRSAQDQQNEPKTSHKQNHEKHRADTRADTASEVAGSTSERALANSFTTLCSRNTWIERSVTHKGHTAARLGAAVDVVNGYVTQQTTLKKSEAHRCPWRHFPRRISRL